MAVIDYKDLAMISNVLGIEGDYTSLEAKFRDMDDQKFIKIYEKMRTKLSAHETARYVDTILELTGYAISTEVANALLTDKHLVKLLNDKRVKKGELVRILRDYKTTPAQQKTVVSKKTEKTKFTYYEFTIKTTYENTVKILFSDEEYEEMTSLAENGRRDKVAKIFRGYKVSPMSIKETRVQPWTITAKEREEMILNIRHGILGVNEHRFLEGRNCNYALIPKKEILSGITAAHLEKLFNMPEGSLRREENEEQPITLNIDFNSDNEIETRDLGTQKMFMGQNESLFSVFNIRDLSRYVVDLPENEYVTYDPLTGTLIPLKEGNIEMCVRSLTNNVVRKITLSVGPSARQSLKAYIQKKKMELTPQENKKDSQ